jgi:hypothetical protein
MVEAGDVTWRVLGLISGVCMVLRSIVGLYQHLFSFHVILDVWMGIFGMFSVMMERKDTNQKVQAIIKQYARLLTNPFGRGIVYLLVGLLILSRAEWLDLLVGGIVMTNSILLLISAKHMSKVFNELHSAKYTESYIMSKFYEFDKDKSGTLDTKELAALCSSLGANLSKNELEVALFVLDADGDGHIAAIEFLRWWKSSTYSLADAYL